MHTHPKPIDFAVAIACSALVLLLTIYPVYHVVSQFFGKGRQQKQTDDLYEDEDGKATVESTKAFSDIIPRTILVVISILGVVFSTLFLVGSYKGALCFITGDSDSCQSPQGSIWIEQCFILQAWVCILVQACILFITRKSVQRYNLGLWGAATGLVLSVSLPVEAIIWNAKSHTFAAVKLHITLLLIEFALALVVSFTFLLLPRRPDVYRDGQLVDRQFSVSAFNLGTFAWSSELLAMVARKKRIALEDLPCISNDARADTLRSDYEKVVKKDRFWKVLWSSHFNLIIAQIVMESIQSASQFLPQITLYAMLRALEQRDAGANNYLELWLLSLAIGGSDALFTWTESWLFYYSFMKVGARVYEQISTIVFCKAVRKKDVKGAASATEEDEKADAGLGEGSDAGSEDEDDEDDEGPPKSKQSTINLIGVDGKRISDFMTYSPMLLGCAIKLVISILFLMKLVGWIPVVSGFAVFGALMPLNWWLTKKYTVTQDDLMKARDNKTATVTEALQGIRQIKFSALETEWNEKIMKTRNKELSAQWTAFMLDTMLISIWILGPVALSAVALTAYALINKGLSPSVAFTTISLFESVEATLAAAPELITEVFDALVSCRRIEQYLDTPDRVDQLKDGDKVVFDNATISWPTDDQSEEGDEEAFKLRNINLAFPPGELSVISGRTGSGKSLLLSSLIGESEILDGSVYVPKAPPVSERHDHKATRANWIIPEAIAYVAQIPWIENATIKDNILFSLPFDKARYTQVLHASALEKDLEILEDGDLTDIGANGINLSGGQKWRVSFARALYSRAGILVLDDIFSAVDAHVGKHLFEEALTGSLGQNRTRILVTHHVALCLPKTKYSVLLGNGTVLQVGLTEELRRTGLLKDILAYDIEEQEKEEEEAKQAEAAKIDEGSSLQRVVSPRLSRPRKESHASVPEDSPAALQTVASERQLPPKKFTEEEKREVGAVKFSVYTAFIRAAGGFWYWGLILGMYFAWSGSFVFRSYWVTLWTRSASTESHPAMAVVQQPGHYMYRLKQEFAEIEMEHSLMYWVGGYLIISIVSWFIGTIKYLMIYAASIQASRKLFENLAFRVLRAPLRFLDTTPVGRILNRFTADFNMVDSKISNDMMFMMHSACMGLAVIASSVFISPYMVLFACLLLSVCFWFAMRYLAGAREVKRLESNAKSPVFEQFGSVLSGIGTIRAFGKAEEYIRRMDERINTHCQAYYHLWLFNRWMGLRVAWVGAFFITGMSLLIVGVKGVDASLAGFALSFALQLSDTITWLLREYANVELDLNSVERILDYSYMAIEDQDGHSAPAAWPTKGELEVNDLEVAYASDLKPVLRGLTFKVKQNERVGVVGRTGAGKSSLTLALFRFLEARSGSIWIDGVDVSKIKLFDLRSRLAIIPQDPVLFSGTVRSNLDPFNQHTDSDLRDALVRVQLITSADAMSSGVASPDHNSENEESSGSSTLGNVNVFSSLSSQISDGGLNLSQGQRQLLCLARAIVSRPKIMVLDEATSSVDMETDALIQRSIREEFADSTLLVIAHRLSTIADFDRILVLGEGKVLEYDEPEVLMAKENGAFRGMVESSGERKELESVIRERQKR